MKFTQFKIKNYKGIENISINLDKSPDANIYTLVGLNESGKTTILEAINFFNPSLSPLQLPGTTITDYNSLIPISKRDNFNEDVYIEATLKLDEADLNKINEFVEEHTEFKYVKPLNEIVHHHYYKFENSKYKKSDLRWTGFDGCLKTSTTEEFIRIAKHNNKSNILLADFCKTLTPSILYFPNFLFDFPSKIYLEKEGELNSKDNFYLELVQDILFSLENNHEIKIHIIDRAKSKEENDRRNLESLIKKINKKVSDIVFGAWNRIFKRELRDTRVVIKCDVDEAGLTFLEFGIESEDGIYKINERSLGFRWFFTFLLFTQFRPFRKNSPQNIIFLFDEPASNLHSSAQSQLLKSFEDLIQNCKIIYTTHSHHLINPLWLESTYVVKNEGLQLETPEIYNVRKTIITIEPYREFVIRHPYHTAYFQPILDVLDYSPSNLENLPSCVFLEGKNDFYTLAFFNDVIFNNEFKINLSPSTGSSNLDTLISLYIGWGRNFIALLDSDKEGEGQKARYLDKFGPIIENKIFTLNDIDSLWNKHSTEKLFKKSESLTFLQTCYPESAKFNKIHFNRAIQEHLINRRYFDFSDDTKVNMKKILEFCKTKLEV